MASTARTYPVLAQHIPAQEYYPGYVAQALQRMATNNEFIVLDTKRVNIAVIMNKTAQRLQMRTFTLKCSEWHMFLACWSRCKNTQRVCQKWSRNARSFSYFNTDGRMRPSVLKYEKLRAFLDHFWQTRWVFLHRDQHAKNICHSLHLSVNVRICNRWAVLFIITAIFTRFVSNTINSLFVAILCKACATYPG